MERTVNAFEIPKQSKVLEGRRNLFPKTLPKAKQNMPQIALPGSAKWPPLQWMKK